MGGKLNGLRVFAAQVDTLSFWSQSVRASAVSRWMRGGRAQIRSARKNSHEAFLVRIELGSMVLGEVV